MNNLLTIVKTEYLTDVRNKSFWIATLVMPLLMVGFGILVGFLSTESSVLSSTANPIIDEDDDLSGWQVLGMMSGVLLTLFIMINGAQIYNKVRLEKCNRIIEILATCVEGRTMMFAKIISVGLVSLTQMLLWLVLAGGIMAGICMVLKPDIPFDFLLDGRFWMAVLWSALFFIGGYVFFGSLYAACGAMTDKNAENQEYMTILTFVLMGSFYLGMYVVDNSTSQISFWCSYIPFTSPTIAPVRAIAGEVPWWETLIQLGVLYGFAYCSVALAGKIFRSALLLTGTKFSPRDIMVFLKSK